MKLFALPATLLAVVAATSVGASTINPADYTTVLTEESREFTIGGADISGNAAIAGNGDIDRFRAPDLNGGDSTLLSGRAFTDDQDRWIFRNVTGLFTVDLLDIAGSSLLPRGEFSTRFVIRVDGNRVARQDFLGDPTSGEALDALPQTLFSQVLNDARVVIVARDRGGASDYDLGVTLASVPLPASSLLLLGGLAGLGAMSRRKRKS